MVDPTRTVDNDEFRDLLRPFTSALSDYAVAMSRHPDSHGHLPSATSNAMRELAAERRWGTPKWSEPARNAHSYGTMLSYVCAEHLSAIAAIIAESRVGPRFAFLPSVRALMETAPIARWLLEPSIGIDRRIRRSIAYRLESANQQGRLREVPDAAEAKRRARAACLDYAASQGWAISGTPTGRPVVGGEALPHPADSFSQVAFGNDSDGLDPTLWGVLSATSHGTWYAVSAGLGERMQRIDPFDPNGGMAPIVVESQQLHLYGLMAYYACDAVTAARADLMSWPDTGELTDARQRLRDITKGFSNQLRDAGVDPR
ncbi:MAG: hypothetical protein KDB37_08320 [Ilumatobacter sp.]|nr:hypothetical protein [Ilumatobacter sp.]